MINLKEKTLANIDTKELAGFLTLFGLAVLTPVLVHTQWIAGSMVNAILLVSLFLFGIKKASIIALFPSLVALSFGLLPVALSLVIPFIMAGNIIYIAIVDFIYKNISEKNGKNYWFGIFFGSCFKFTFLFLIASLVVKFFVSGSAALKIGQMMTGVQFITAISGGIIAWIILKWLKKI